MYSLEFDTVKLITLMKKILKICALVGIFCFTFYNSVLLMSKRQISSAVLKTEIIKKHNIFLLSALAVINGLADFTLN